MLLRKYQSADCEKLAELFYNTVHSVNAMDYTEEQLNAWSTGEVDLQKWDKSFQEHKTVIAVDGDEIIGCGDIDGTGYLDRLYVHRDHQREGVATAICDELEGSVNGKRIFTHASVTARRFFEKRGYIVIAEQRVVRNGVSMVNYKVEKRL